jgi:SAM-dependent methyltransferase
VDRGLPPVSDPSFWDAVYRDGTDEFELGHAAPPLERAARERPPGAGEALVLGCGRGHEARLLAALGWEKVIAVDFSPVALEEARSLTEGTGLEKKIEWRQADLFALGGADSERFDLAVEHCCFCAIDPSRRGEWAHVVRRVLRAHGHLLALFYHCGRVGGPPFDATRPEIERIMAGRFVIEHVEIPRDSVPKRQGKEILVRARRL